MHRTRTCRRTHEVARQRDNRARTHGITSFAFLGPQNAAQPCQAIVHDRERGVIVRCGLVAGHQGRHRIKDTQ